MAATERKRAVSAGLSRSKPPNAEPQAPSLLELLKQEAAETSPRKGERTRRLILYATACCLEREASSALNMDDIADQAGISRAALYQYFRSKSDVVGVVLERLHRLTAAIPHDPRWREMTLYDKVFQTNRAYMLFFRSNALLIERLNESHDEFPALAALRREANLKLASRVAATVPGPHTATSRKALVTRVLALECMMDSVLREAYVLQSRYFPPDEISLDGLCKELTEIWLNGLYDGWASARIGLKG